MVPDQTLNEIKHVVNKVCAQELTKTSIFNYDEIYEAANILNGSIPLVEVAIKIAQDTMLPLSYWADQISKRGYHVHKKVNK